MHAFARPLVHPSRRFPDESNPPARPSRLQVGSSGEHRLEAIPGIPTFRPIGRRCWPALRGCPLRDQSQSARRREAHATHAPRGPRVHRHFRRTRGSSAAWQAIAMLCKLSEKLFPVGAFLPRGASRSFGSTTRFSRSRGDWIRTSDRPAPSRVRYQTAPLPVASDPSLARDDSKRATGIEPALEAWKASVQPQHFARRLLRMIPAHTASSELPTAAAAGPARQTPAAHSPSVPTPR
jgi:hypothetical protein